MLLGEIRKLYGGRTIEYMGANNHELWLSMYRGEMPWLNADVMSLNLPCTIAGKIATTVTLEMESHVNGHDELDEEYQVLLNDIKRITEYGLALGGVIIKPFQAEENKVSYDVVTPDRFLPLDVDSFGNISRIVFLEQIQKLEGRTVIYYTRVEEHDRQVGQYIVKNRAYRSESQYTIGDEISLELVEEWQDIAEEETYTDVEGNLFGYYKNAQANNLDLNSPLGVSCFSRATSLIQDADEQYSRLIWENEGGELAIDADITMFMGDYLNEIPRGKERLFRKLNGGDDSMYQVFSPQLRDVSLINTLNEILKKIEIVCSLSPGMLSNVDYMAKTATEIKSMKQEFYSTVVGNQRNLEVALRDTAKAMAYWLGIKGELDIAFDFDDSVVVDSTTEQNIRLQEVAAGIIKPEEYLKWRYGVSEEEAKDMMPEPEEPQEKYNQWDEEE
ncbi:MAG: phage portal protein [Tissierellia bacterium]|nr:phage portal protein [Tissierellia bacterium]